MHCEVARKNLVTAFFQYEIIYATMGANELKPKTISIPLYQDESPVAAILSLLITPRRPR